jgi:transcriptional regulator with XRE-family HTH domain
MEPRSKNAEKMGQALQGARRKANLTQEAVAKKVGTETSYYAKLEQGNSIPSLKMLYKIAKVLNVHSSEILPF